MHIVAKFFVLIIIRILPLRAVVRNLGLPSTCHRNPFPVTSLYRLSPLFARTITHSTKSKMSAELIDGNAIAAQIRVELKENVRVLQESLGATPGLAVVLVGERRDSATYVRMKKKACAEIGINSFGFDYPASITEAELLAKVDELNAGTYSFHSALRTYSLFCSNL